MAAWGLLVCGSAVVGQLISAEAVKAESGTRSEWALAELPSFEFSKSSKFRLAGAAARAEFPEASWIAATNAVPKPMAKMTMSGDAEPRRVSPPAGESRPAGGFDPSLARPRIRTAPPTFVPADGPSGDIPRGVRSEPPVASPQTVGQRGSDVFGRLGGGEGRRDSAFSMPSRPMVGPPVGVRSKLTVPAAGVGYSSLVPQRR